MTPKQLEDTLAALRATRERLLAGGPEACRDWVYRSMGYLNADGTLTKQYGGDTTDADHPYWSAKP